MKLNGPRSYPAAWSGLLTTALATLVAFKVFNQDTANYVAASGTAVLGLATAALARPVVVPAITAAMGTFLVSLGGFGLHLDDAKLAGIMGASTALLTWYVHSNVVPTAGSPAVADPQLHPLVHSSGPVQPPPAAAPHP